jgi:hypothetical protein
MERQFLLVLGAPLRIRATDLERIPREGSLSTDPRDLPAPGVRPTATLPRDRLRRCVVLASPGILGPNVTQLSVTSQPQKTSELECKPLKVVNGVDVIDVSGQAVDIRTLLGFGSGGLMGGIATPDKTLGEQQHIDYAKKIIISGVTLFGVIVGFLVANWFFGLLWRPFFIMTPRLKSDTWLKIKILTFVIVIFFNINSLINS